jgi:uncharacterized protein
MAAVAEVLALDAGSLAPGTRRSFALAVVELADGSTLRVPVHVAVGREVGPCLAVVAGVHGDEPEGIVAVDRLWREERLAELRGTLLLVPVANPPAFAAHQRRSPLDGIDLNRVFPGDPRGRPSERLAHSLFELVAGNAQFLYTLHSWFATGEALPHVEFQDGPPVREASLAGAFGCGFPYLRASDWHPGVFPRAVSDAGIPAIECEVGGGGLVSDAYRDVMRQSILALMRHLEMLPGAAPARPDAMVCRSLHVVATTGGMLRLGVDLGGRVAQEEQVGVVTDLHGRVRESLHAPASGVVAALRRAVSVGPGDMVVRILTPAEFQLSGGAGAWVPDEQPVR